MLRVLVLLAGAAGLIGLLEGCGQPADTSRSMTWESLEEVARAVAREDDRVFPVAIPPVSPTTSVRRFGMAQRIREVRPAIPG